MADAITITVYGTPAPQGSKRAFAVRGKGGVPTGRVAVIESSHDRVKSWRQAVIDAADAVRAGDLAAWKPLDGPLLVRMVFYFRRPQAHYRTGKHAALLREAAPEYHTKTPDTSKLVRATEDALTDAGAWRDDALVTTLQARKTWANSDRPPGAVITITPLGGAGQ